MQRLTETETAQWLSGRDLPLWIMDEARGSISRKWTGENGMSVTYDMGDGFYWITETPMITRKSIF